MAHSEKTEQINKVLIVGITPYFLEKENFWFEKNLNKILEAAKTQPFFEENTLFVETNRYYNLSQFLRKLDEMGYEKVFQVSEPGEFSQRGGVIDVFPINTASAARFEFMGNAIDIIERLPIIIEDEKHSREILKKKLKSQKLFSDLKGLKLGDYLVHLDHGVAEFSEITKIGGHNYYVLTYAKDDKLYVPLGLERKLSRYIGFTSPKISRLGSALWQKIKHRLKEDAEKLAKELLEIYAKKEEARRPPYLPDDEIELQLAGKFPYKETPDQIEAIEDIKRDMEKTKPMDRIVCGDVGFGKTEVALRAMIKAVKSGYETAMLCPTTILANQHYQNFKERLNNLPMNPSPPQAAGYPVADGTSSFGGFHPRPPLRQSFPHRLVNEAGSEASKGRGILATEIKIAILSRLQSKKEQKRIVEDLKDGNIDILVGTHRILSNDIVFKNLGLLVIDDEQRFGVKQKEKLKKMRSPLDVLSLSATPIPRTLYMSLSSLKDISLIQTPPENRLAVKNFILPWNEKIIKNAIREEISRNGQVYYLHNRVETIGAVKKFLEKLVPEASFAIAHGRMKENKLIDAMNDFQNKKINVLIATTIIESGLDMPNVNTLIVADATRLGLSQAYQIRGRIGRSHIQATAFFFFGKKLADKAEERLKALKEAEELGSGYRVAMRDLEIRGAGNILGKEQSGSINAVGLNLYCQMLSEAIEKLKTKNYE